MKCRRCGKEIGNYTRCTFCGYENIEGNVREMTDTEKNFYEGVTIDTGENSNQNNSNYRRRTTYKPSYTHSRRTFFTLQAVQVPFRVLSEKFLQNYLIMN